MAGNGGTLSPLLAVLLVLCCLPLLTAAAGEWWGSSRAHRSSQPHLFRVGARSYLACMVVSDDELPSGEEQVRGERAAVARGCVRPPACLSACLPACAAIGGSICLHRGILAELFAAAKRRRDSRS